LRAEITTSCRIESTRYTRINRLGWAILCPYANYLNWHGSIPLEEPKYPTGDELRSIHDKIVTLVDSVFEYTNKYRIIARWREMELYLAFRKKIVENTYENLCAKGKADLVYLIKAGHKLILIYIDIASTRINVAKPWQIILRGLSLYYMFRIPVGLIIISPNKFMYKLLSNRDQKQVLKKIMSQLVIDDNKISMEEDKANPNLCSLCELAHYCPWRSI